jgi:hypothetical protein
MLHVDCRCFCCCCSCHLHDTFVSFDIHWSIDVYQPFRLVKNHWTHGGYGFFCKRESLFIINSHTLGQKQKPSLPGNFKNRKVCILSQEGTDGRRKAHTVHACVGACVHA